MTIVEYGTKVQISRYNKYYKKKFIVIDLFFVYISMHIHQAVV